MAYYGELRSLRADTTQHAASPVLQVKTVFVSSTYRDLVAHRAAIKEQIARRYLLFHGMEFFGADAELEPSIKIVAEVRRANVYLGIFGVRYGSVDPSTGFSMTELEYTEAKISGKPMLLYVIRENATVKVSDIELDPASRAKLEDLKKRILRDHTVYMFSDVKDLERQVYEDLGKIAAPESTAARA